MAPTRSAHASLLHAVLDELAIEPEWRVTAPGGVGFVVSRAGTWLQLHESERGAPVLTVETRLATGVVDTREVQDFCDAGNYLSLAGRWVHDPATGVVALRADLPMDTAWVPAVLGEVVAEMTDVADGVAYAEQLPEKLGTAAAVTRVAGRRRVAPHRMFGHVLDHVVPLGGTGDIASRVLPLVQDELLWALPGWYVEHGPDESRCQADDGSLLRVLVAGHPHAGWGLLVSVGGEPYRADLTDALPGLATLNRVEADRAGDTAGLGCWTHGGAGIEYRAFVTSALLCAAADDLKAAAMVLDLVVAAASRADAALVHKPLPRPTRPPLVHPHWHDDAPSA